MAVGRPRWPTGAKPPRVSIIFRENPAFLPTVTMTARKIMQDTAMAVKVQAKHNVAPGIGPGPHPHRTPHVDTGNLMRSIFYRTWQKGKLEVGFTVGTPLNYGLFLEVGWQTKSGSFFRYPWLMPALMSAAPLELAASMAKYRF